MASVGAEQLGAQRLAGQAPLTERIRAFFAVALPETNRERLAAHLLACAAAAPAFRWSDPNNLHLTVRFVGSVEREVVEAIADRVQGSRLEISLGEIGTFKRGGLARVVWLGVQQGVDGLTALADVVEAECRTAGLEPDERPLKPHLTLARARARQGAALPALPPLPDLESWRADELVLYSSHLGRGGAVHEPIRAVRLAAL